MKRMIKTAIAGTGAAAIVVATAGAALAATPPWQPGGGGSGANGTPDTHNIGTLAFYNAAGTQILGGSSTAPLAAFEQAVTGSFPTSGSASLFFYTPNSGSPAGAWSGSPIGVANSYPVATAPGSLGTSTKPVVKEDLANDLSVEDYATNNFPNGDANPAYQNLYEVRLFAGTNGDYASADIQFDSTAHTWSQVFPTVTAAATTTTATVTPGGTTTSAATAETLGATVTTASGTPTGSVQFVVDGANFGSPVTLTAGAASLSTTAGALGAGTHAIKAVYTSNQPVTFANSTSSDVTFTYNAPADATSTSLAVTPATGAAFSSQHYAIHVTDTTTSSAHPLGTISLFDNGSASAFLSGVPVSATTGDAAVDSNALGGGAHSVVAKFVPSGSGFATSSSPSVDFTLTNAGATPDPQTIDVVVAPGSLTISTPYTPASPFHLGTAVLQPGGTELIATAPFGSVTAPTSTTPGQPNTPFDYDGVTITDTRAGNNAWTASASAIDFSSATTSSTIPAANLSLTNVAPLYITGNALQAGDVVPSNVASFTAGPHAFATAAAPGVGSVYVHGTLTLHIPTSVEAGTYTSTVTFTLA